MEVQIKWRGRQLKIFVEAQWTVLDLKLRVEAQTGIPVKGQRYLWRRRGAKVEDGEKLMGLIEKGRAVLLLGEPAGEKKAGMRQGSSVNVVDDLEEIERTASPQQDVEIDGIPSLIEGEEGVDVEGFEERNWRMWPPQEAPQETVEDNGRRGLGLEDIGWELTGAVVGSEFVQRGETYGVRFLEVDTFLEAVSAAKRELKMLVVLLTNFGDAEGGVDAEESAGMGVTVASGGSSGRKERCERFMEQELMQGELVDYLNANTLVFPVDLQNMMNGGAAFLNKMGLFDVPAMVVLCESSTGMMVVDIFATEFVVGTTGILPRMLGLHETYDGFYEEGRARRAASSLRIAEINQQNRDFAESLEADIRAREERERKEREEQRKTEEDRRRAVVEEERKRVEMEEARQRLPEEAESGTQILVMIPDGRRIARRFKNDNQVSALFDLCVANGVKKGTFVLNSRFPRKTFRLEEHGQDTLENSNLKEQALLFVEFIE